MSAVAPFLSSSSSSLGRARVPPCPLLLGRIRRLPSGCKRDFDPGIAPLSRFVTCVAHHRRFPRPASPLLQQTLGQALLFSWALPLLVQPHSYAGRAPHVVLLLLLLPVPHVFLA
ncbi:hypothetical protein LX36DRAFT_205333 [Colletotrichum falcatum]|nr:hypothetical protein LX36DRAFT_205333 [Colletotrichum falcatum]